MVRMSNSNGRRRNNRHFAFNKKFLNVNYFVWLVTGVVGLSVTIYFYLLKSEDGGADTKSNSNPTKLSSVQQQQLATDRMSLLKGSKPFPRGSAARVVAAKEPFIVYGTAWKKDRTAAHVEQAIRSGFRFIDTACQPKHYNEAGVGDGWTKAALELNLNRQDIFLQTKYTSINGQDPNNIPYDPDATLEDQVKQSLEVSLKNLKTAYLDSLVMHSPERRFDDTLRVYRTMESFVDDGRVLRLGISNCYNYEIFTKLYQEARIKPSVLQNRLYSETNFDPELRQFCKEKGIWYQSFWTLTAQSNRQALASTEVREWAKEKSLTPQTMMFAFLLQLGYVTPLSGTTNPNHMKEDIAIMTRIQDGEKIFENEEEMLRFQKLLGMP